MDEQGQGKEGKEKDYRGVKVTAGEEECEFEPKKKKSLIKLSDVEREREKKKSMAEGAEEDELAGQCQF